MNHFLKDFRSRFEYYKSLGDKTCTQLSQENLFWKASSDSNSIAIIVNHLHGNMLSRWTDFLTTDGEKEWRKRDNEFEDVLKTQQEVFEKWEEGWACLFYALDKLSSDDLGQHIEIRNQKHTVHEALNRQLAHYAYHIGQIVFIGKAVQNTDWKTLSIAKGKSKEYNKTLS